MKYEFYDGSDEAARDWADLEPTPEELAVEFIDDIGDDDPTLTDPDIRRAAAELAELEKQTADAQKQHS